MIVQVMRICLCCLGNEALKSACICKVAPPREEIFVWIKLLVNVNYLATISWTCQAALIVCRGYVRLAHVMRICLCCLGR